MPQEVSTNQIAVKSLEGKSDQPWSMDANANRLMDDIFADVERILETGSETPTIPAEPAEYVSFPKMAVPSVTIPAEITSRSTVAEEITKPETTLTKRQQSGKSLEKWLLIGACASLAITLLLWVLGQGRLNSLLENNSASTPKATQASQKDLAFVDYMQRSLESLDQKAENRQQVPVVPPAPPPTQPPLPVLTPGNLPQNASRPNVLERVYIPVYPQPRIIYTNPPSPAATPSPQAAAPSRATSPTPKATSPTPKATSPTPKATSPTPKATSPTPKATSPTPKATSPTPKATSPTPKAASPTPKATSPTPKATSPTPAPSPKPEARPTSRPVATAPTVPRLSAALPTQTASPTAGPTTAAAKPTPSPTQTALPSPTARPTTVAAKPNPSPTQAASESPRVVAVPPSPTMQPTFRNRSPQATASTPGNQYSLRGVLVLGERSAAIFEVAGVSRRVYVGESIGSSGWTLVEINNENSEAVIRRNGEVRSIFVGQQF
ncbi:hypothetical protein ACE1CI_09810 [Aerosakkonemataceae cyanobacterium BLCC-F50]|uniref:Type II secretion system protein GspC N-terminal domain-containing protein n=1 Tax=Floridaenema flaviceps BLCC-F50 TaxID=3153642 RepID=A0ABV4XNT3_9CYAN